MTVLLGLLTGVAALLTIMRSFRKRKRLVLSKGMVESIEGLTVHLKNEDGYNLSILCQRGTDGEDKNYDVMKDTISFEYIFRGKSKILTAYLYGGKVLVNIL